MSTEERVRIWRHNEAIAMKALTDHGKPGDVVFVIDARDSFGRDILDAVSEVNGTDVATHAAKVEKRGEIPTGIALLPADLAAKMVALRNPRVGDALKAKPIDGHVFVVVISGEGTTLLMPPRVDVRTAGSA